MESWSIDLIDGKARHYSGLTLVFQPASSLPGTVEARYYYQGNNEATIKTARLIRQGLDAYRNAYRARHHKIPLIRLRVAP